MTELVVAGLHLLALLGLLVLVAPVGRRVAGRLRLPLAIGEILVSLLVGPALLALAGGRRFGLLLPEHLADPLATVGEVGPVLFRVGVVHRPEHGSAGRWNATTARVTTGTGPTGPLLSTIDACAARRESPARQGGA
ncbi:hypothetical protein [Streptomyces sp. NPDC002490]|uniref:hypothetical protein n=1 Tax=Streptomyces sp. NPDC002490 TaxID=3154416 RepID=UPI00331CC302